MSFFSSKRRIFRPVIRPLSVSVNRAVVTAALVMAACLLLSISAYQFRPMPKSLIHFRPTPELENYYRDGAVEFLIAGAFVLLLALIVNQRMIFPAPFERIPGAWPMLSLRSLLMVDLGVLALLTLAEINGGLAGVKVLKYRSNQTQFALLAGGLALLAAGLSGIGRPRRASIAQIPWNEVAIVGLITLFAFGVRVWKLGDLVRVLVDEVHFTLGVNYFRAYHDVKLLAPMPTSASFPFIFSYGQFTGVEWFGRNLFGLRIFSAVLGTLTIPALYVLARELFDRWTAILAALLLAAFPPHIHYSRLALNNIADPLFGTLALAFVARGWRTDRRLDFVLAGISLGLTQYFYEGGRLLYPALLAAWSGTGLVLWRPRPSWRGLILLAMAFIVVAVPVYYTLEGTDFPTLNRMDNTGLNDRYWATGREPNTLETRWEHLRHSFEMYVNSPENTFIYYYLYYGGKHPLILEYIIPLFFLGIVFALWRWRTPGVLPVPWVLATSLGNMMMVESGVTARYVVAFPALALLIALGIRYTIPLLWPSRLPSKIQPLLMGVIVGGLVAAQTIFYFGPFMDLFNVEVRAHVDNDVEDALLRSLDFPNNTQIHIIGTRVLPPIDTQRFLSYLRDGAIVEVVPPGTYQPMGLLSLPRTVDHAFFVSSSDSYTISALINTFGSQPLLYSSNKDIPREKQFALYYLPALPYIKRPEDAQNAVG
ncbi:MAG TPA: glycosyltransferase family 39 protein [Aggregatilineaceae bacterium]|nr:glycosyltransferase family 39 protein [Aggregatilineaceae bacterium]